MRHTINHDAPIGVFDSGLGGLTVVKALMKYLPREDVVYFGDTARVPYGTKSPEAIIRFSRQNALILQKSRVKMIVVACNTSSSYALPAIHKSVPVPVVGVIDPGVKKALSVTRNKRIGILATPATIRSDAYAKRIKFYNRKIVVVSQACPLFVPLVEEGWLDKEATFMIAREYLKRLKTAGVDTVILGCTHYPLLKTTLQKVLGKSVVLIDSAQEVAYEVKTLLEGLDAKRRGSRPACYRFLSSDAPQHFLRSASKFLGYKIKRVRKCDHPS